MLVYKVAETSRVTDEELEKIINQHVGQGWSLDGIRFVVRDASRRPAMAFITFTRDDPNAPTAPPDRDPEIP